MRAYVPMCESGFEHRGASAGVLGEAAPAVAAPTLVGVETRHRMGGTRSRALMRGFWIGKSKQGGVRIRK